MATISLRSDLWERLKQAATLTHSSAEDLAEAAFNDYLERLAEQTITAESDAFVEMHSKLLQEYRGEYVAMHERRVVDSDADFEALFLRVQARFGQTPVLIRQITESPTPEYRARRPILETAE
jgi:hypothetical protein